MSDCDHSDELPDDWSAEQHALFLRMFRHLSASQRAFVHPDAPPVSAERWETTAWNVAYFAAHCIGDDSPFIIHANEEGDVFSAEVPSKELQ